MPSNNPQRDAAHIATTEALSKLSVAVGSTLRVAEIEAQQQELQDDLFQLAEAFAQQAGIVISMDRDLALQKAWTRLLELDRAERLLETVTTAVREARLENRIIDAINSGELEKEFATKLAALRTSAGGTLPAEVKEKCATLQRQWAERRAAPEAKLDVEHATKLCLYCHMMLPKWRAAARREYEKARADVPRRELAERTPEQVRHTIENRGLFGG